MLGLVAGGYYRNLQGCEIRDSKKAHFVAIKNWTLPKQNSLQRQIIPRYISRKCGTVTGLNGYWKILQRLTWGIGLRKTWYWTWNQYIIKFSPWHGYISWLYFDWMWKETGIAFCPRLSHFPSRNYGTNSLAGHPLSSEEHFQLDWEQKWEIRSQIKFSTPAGREVINIELKK